MHQLHIEKYIPTFLNILLYLFLNLSRVIVFKEFVGFLKILDFISINHPGNIIVTNTQITLLFKCFCFSGLMQSNIKNLDKAEAHSFTEK